MESADRVESAFLWNIADRVEYSGQGEERAFLGGTSRLLRAVRLKRDLTEERCVTIADRGAPKGGPKGGSRRGARAARAVF